MERPIYFPEAEENIRKAKEAAEAAKQREKAHKEALKENKARDKAKQDKYAEDYKAAVKENKARDKAKEDKYSEDDFQRLFIKEKTEDSADTTGTDKPTETPNTTEQTEPVVEPVVDTTTEAIPNKPIENTPSTTSKKDEDSTYEYDPMNPIFGKKGFHVGDKAERLPAELEEDEKEKARDEKQK